LNREKDVDDILGRKAGEGGGASESKEAGSSSGNNDVVMSDAGDDEEAAALRAALAMSMGEAVQTSTSAVAKVSQT